MHEIPVLRTEEIVPLVKRWFFERKRSRVVTFADFNYWAQCDNEYLYKLQDGADAYALAIPELLPHVVEFGELIEYERLREFMHNYDGSGAVTGFKFRDRPGSRFHFELESEAVFMRMAF
jgi:hypothetical protein